jgi:hypothetical protein
MVVLLVVGGPAARLEALGRTCWRVVAAAALVDDFALPHIALVADPAPIGLLVAPDANRPRNASAVTEAAERYRCMTDRAWRRD